MRLALILTSYSMATSFFVGGFWKLVSECRSALQTTMNYTQRAPIWFTYPFYVSLMVFYYINSHQVLGDGKVDISPFYIVLE